MKYLKKFKNQTAYQQYISADDIWLPRVSWILNKGDTTPTTQNKYSDNGPSRVEYSRLGTEFIQVANGGIMYFTDQVYDGVSYTAAVDGETIVIRTTNLESGELTGDAYIDEENSQIVVNYPPNSNTAKTFAIPMG